MKFLLTPLLWVYFATFVAANDTVVIVFDTSGSMAEYMRVAGKSRMAVAQDSLVKVLSGIPDTTHVGLITFNGWVYDIAPVDKTRLSESILAIEPKGGTPLYRYIRDGATRLLQERDKNKNVGRYKLLVVTDGEAGDNTLNKTVLTKDGIRPGVLKDIISRGITIDTIALDIRGEHSLKSTINGTYMAANNQEILETYLSESVSSFDNDLVIHPSQFRNHPIGTIKPAVPTFVNGDITVEVLKTPSSGETIILVGCIIVVLLTLVADFWHLCKKNYSASALFAAAIVWTCVIASCVLSYIYWWVPTQHKPKSHKSLAKIGIVFMDGTDTITTDSENELNEIVDSWGTVADTYFVVKGHLTPEDHSQENKNVALSRELAIGKWLLDHGVADSRINPKTTASK